MKFLKNLIPSKETFLDKQKRYVFQLALVSMVFSIVGVIFTIINIINKEWGLCIATASFSVVSLITFILVKVHKKEKQRALIEFFFVTAVVILFGYFLIDGGAGPKNLGFSTYWIIILPFLTMLVLGIKKGSITTGVMFIAIVILLWIPPVTKALVKWEPSDTFRLRFPLVYLAAFASSLLFAYSRYLMEKSNDELIKMLSETATHDFLTKIYNRAGLSDLVKRFDERKQKGDINNLACILLDIDNFKGANDVYGHAFGDEVLVTLANIMLSSVHGDEEQLIRFGGDEFIVICTNTTLKRANEIAEEIRSKAEKHHFDSHPEYKFTISAGVGYTAVDQDYRMNRIIEVADSLSAKAKKHGKNMIYSISYDDTVVLAPAAKTKNTK